MSIEKILPLQAGKSTFRALPHQQCEQQRQSAAQVRKASDCRIRNRVLSPVDLMVQSLQHVPAGESIQRLKVHRLRQVGDGIRDQACRPAKNSNQKALYAQESVVHASLD